MIGDCSAACASVGPVERLNRECFCVAVDEKALRARLEATLASHGLPMSLAESHAHLFSALPVFVSRPQLSQIEKVVAAIEEVSTLPAYRSAVMSWAPDIAGFDPGSPGGILGFDFHLGPDGPRLIEINTNPGGALLNVLLGQAHRGCTLDLADATNDLEGVEQAILDAAMTEWRLQGGTAAPGLIAIVDHAPERQYLYPEFVLYRELFRRNGLRAEICSPDQLTARDNRLWLGDYPVDLVYNRLTDFSLQEPAHRLLREAYLAGGVAVSPHPRAHAMYADKRNLIILGDADLLRAANASQEAIHTLSAAVPHTQLLTPDNREALWAGRRRLFFKPATGFGSKAGYRGDKLTRRVWAEIAGGTYVAQQIVTPSERQLEPGCDPLKVDIRCYAYRGRVLLYAARMYQGQTTNFRTRGGGFAHVLTSAVTSA